VKSLKSLKEYPSQSEPGVSYVLRIVTVNRRDKLDGLLAENYAKRREILQKFEAAKALGETPEAYGAVLECQTELRQAEEMKARIEITWALHSIKGLMVDENEVRTVDDLFASAPLHLVQEIHKAVQESMGLTVGDAKNSESPSTSSAAEGGKTNLTIAQTASETGTTGPETAAGTSQNS
jgi:hypothetical protein